MSTGDHDFPEYVGDTERCRRCGQISPRDPCPGAPKRNRGWKRSAPDRDGILDRRLELADGTRARVRPDARKCWLWAVWLARSPDPYRDTRAPDVEGVADSEDAAKTRVDLAIAAGWHGYYRDAQLNWDSERACLERIPEEAEVPSAGPGPFARAYSLRERLTLLVEDRDRVQRLLGTRSAAGGRW